MRSFVIIALLIIHSCLLNAQEVHPVSSAATKKLVKVKEALDRLDWAEAGNLSEKLVRQYPDWTEAWKAFAEASLGGGNKVASEIALKRLVKLDSAGYPEAWRWLAEWSFNRGEYQEASVFMAKYSKLTPSDVNRPYPVKLLESSISFALNQVSKKDISPSGKLPGPVNTVDDEYFPSLSVDGSVLVYTRQTPTAADPGRSSQEDLFFVKFQDAGYPDPEPFPFPINTPGNEGTQSLRQDGRIMFFTACSRPDSKGGCDIYYCVKSGDQWSDPLNLGYPVNSRYWESTPYLANDGSRLFFASNRPGGFGGMDIWVSTLNPDRSWSAPRNLGQPVNTPLDELAPMLFVDGKTLFFASNGHIGMGGFDLYKSDISNSGRSIFPENLGYRVNTWHDETGLTVNAEKNLGLYASDRDSLTGKDIYLVDMSPYIPANTVFTLSGTVLNRITRQQVGARVEVQPHGDSLISRVEADPITGSFLLAIPERASYRIGAASPGYLPYSSYFIHDSLDNAGQLILTVELEPIKTGAVIVLHNIFFQLDSYELLPGSEQDLGEILTVFNQNPGIEIEISGYTDSTGKDEYNLVLSQKRAESVMKYLISKGIKPGQLQARGYGKANPLASNDTEEGRSLNRRTEMKVLRLN